MDLTQRLPQLILLGVLGYLPFRQLVGRWLEKVSAPEPLILFSQILPELLLIGGVIVVLIRSRPGRPPWLIVLALALLAWSLITALFNASDLGQGWIGIRHDFVGLFALLLVWLAGARIDRIRLIRLVERGILLLATIGLVQFVIGPAFSDTLGYQRHYVGVIPQVHALLYSPNQLASLMLLGAALALRRPASPGSVGLLVLYGAVLGLTYSRSAWIGAAVLGAGLLAHRLRYRAFDWRPLVLGAALTAGLLVGMIRYGEGWRAVVLHGESTIEHIQASSSALSMEGDSIWPLVVGEGIGTAGPASFRTEEPKIAESWYLQLIQEIGLVGLSLYLALLSVAVWLLFRAGEAALGWLSLGLSANALFLHIWADNYYLNLAVWLIVAVIVFSTSKKTKKP